MDKWIVNMVDGSGITVSLEDEDILSLLSHSGNRFAKFGDRVINLENVISCVKLKNGKAV